MWVIVLLLYTAIWVPYKVCFTDKTSDAQFWWDCFVDLCFFIDIILTFFSAVEDGSRIIDERGEIAMKYIKSGWFFTDTFTTIPFQVIEKITAD